MTIALLLIPYTAFLIIWAFLSIFAIYHLVEFSVQNFATYIATFLYIASATLILSFSFVFIANVNWSTPLL